MISANDPYLCKIFCMIINIIRNNHIVFIVFFFCWMDESVKSEEEIVAGEEGEASAVKSRGWGRPPIVRFI